MLPELPRTQGRLGPPDQFPAHLASDHTLETGDTLDLVDPLPQSSDEHAWLL